MSARAFDAVVIGAGVGGLAAACYLAKSGKRVLVVEARNKLGGRCESAPLGEGFTVPIAEHALCALDPRLVKDLKLAKNGLKFVVRDMPLVGLGSGGRHIVITRDVHDTARNIAIHSKADAEAWPSFQRKLFALARTLRPLWWEVAPAGPLDDEARAMVERLERVSAAAWLDSWFESDVLKATLAFDATAGGTSPFEPGSALILLWRAAQEMNGLQSAAAWPAGGPAALATALATQAKALGVEIQTGAFVGRVLLQDERVAGVTLASGETIATAMAFSSLSRRVTLGKLVPAGAAGFETLAALPPNASTGQAKILLALKSLPAFNGMAVPGTARFILADRLESYAAAWSSARAGRLPDELTLEFIVPTRAEPSLAPHGQHVVSVLARPVPIAMDEAMKTLLAARVASALDAHANGFAKHLGAVEVLSPSDTVARYGHDRDDVGGILLNWNQRIMTPIPGLYLCNAEPVPEISGRAGRIAAALALETAR